MGDSIHSAIVGLPADEKVGVKYKLPCVPAVCPAVGALNEIALVGLSLRLPKATLPLCAKQANLFQTFVA